MDKALVKAPLKFRQVNGRFEHGINNPAVPQHRGDSAKAKTHQLSPALLPLSQAPSMDLGLQ